MRWHYEKVGEWRQQQALQIGLYREDENMTGKQTPFSWFHREKLLVAWQVTEFNFYVNRKVVKGNETGRFSIASPTKWIISTFPYFACLHFRSRWPRGIRRGFAAARLLRLRVRIPPVCGCLSVVSVVCCQVEVSAPGWSLVQRSPTECDQMQP